MANSIAGSSSISSYTAELDRLIHQTRTRLDYASDPERKWVTGYLGDPFSGIWFVGENSSRKQVDLVVKQLGALGKVATRENQWWKSAADHLFRKALAQARFKDRPELEAGGWHCYVTDMIKEDPGVGSWNKGLNDDGRFERAKGWRDVLAWELEHSRPKMIVHMSRRGQGWFAKMFGSDGGVGAESDYVPHYAYALRFGRAAEYIEQVVAIRTSFDRLMSTPRGVRQSGS